LIFDSSIDLVVHHFVNILYYVLICHRDLASICLKVNCRLLSCHCVFFFDLETKTEVFDVPLVCLQEDQVFVKLFVKVPEVLKACRLIGEFLKEELRKNRFNVDSL
jgi:hypothetical protein